MEDTVGKYRIFEKKALAGSDFGGGGWVTSRLRDGVGVSCGEDFTDLGHASCMGSGIPHRVIVDFMQI